MNSIFPTLISGATGTAAADLVRAVLFLASHGAVKTYVAPNRPTAEDLGKLTSAAEDELAVASFGPATRVLLEYLLLQNGFKGARRGVVDEPTAALINRLLNRLGAFSDASNTNQRVVRGRVTRMDGTPVDGMTVRARDRDLRTFQALGKNVITDGDGRYSIAYSTSEFSRAEKGGADLVVSVFAAGAATDKPVAESATLFNAPADAEIDFQLPNLPDSLSEYEHHVGDIRPLLQGQAEGGKDLAFTDLTAADQDFIAHETAIAPSHILCLRQSFAASVQASQHQPLSPETCYAWFRQGVSGELRSALRKSTPDLIGLVQSAITSNIVPRVSSAALKTLASTIDVLRLDLALAPAADPGSGSLGDLLATIPNRLSAAKERVVAGVLQNATLSDADLVRQLTNARFSDSEIAAVQVTRALADLTINQAGVMRDLQKLRKSDSDRSLKFLAPLTPVQWLELAYNNQTPAAATPSPEVYAQQMQDALESLHPSAILSARIGSGDWLTPTDGLQKAADFLAAHPDLELRGTNVLSFVNTLKPTADTPAIVSGLQAFQRVQNLTRSWRDTGALLDLGMGTVRDVVRRGASGFTAAVAERMPPERAAAVYAEASRIHNTTVAVIGSAYAGGRQPGFGTPGSTGAGGSNNAPPVTIDPAQFPNLAVLFGGQSTCDCEECQSVLSPAAYLVDLLQFLDPANGQSASSARSVLLGRRPDIADIELTCANTNIEVPYVDLVLEVLENAIAIPIDIVAPYGFDPRVDLAQAPLSTAVAAALRKVLSRSAETIAEPLSVVKSQKNLLSGTFDDWLVNDGFRHWVLRYYPESLTSQRPPSVPQPLNVADYTAALAALDGGRVLTNDWVLPASRDPRDKNLPLDGVPTVTTVTAGTAWTATYTRAVRVAITLHGNTGTLALKTVDGTQQIKSVNGSAGPLQSLVSRLNAGRVAEPLISLLPPSTRYKVVKDGNEWVASLSATVNFAYTAQSLQIASLTYQSSDARTDTLASPENRNPEAYRILDGAVYPWSLPFNLWLEEVRVFLVRRGIPRRNLMEQCNPATRLSSPAVAREVLGLSLSQATIIVGADGHSTWEFWGLKQSQNRVVDRNDPTIVATGTWLNVLGTNISILLQQSSLGYRELLNLLQTQFVRAVAPVLEPSGDECDPSQMKLTGLDAPHLDRIHRLVRLWRLVGGSIFDLDLSIAATTVNPTTLDADALSRVACILRIQQSLGIAVSEIAAWWGGMTASYIDYTVDDHTTVPSVYQRWFLNTNITNPPDSALALNPQLTELQYANAANPPALASESASLIAVLQISQTDFDALVADLVSRNEITAPAVLNLHNLALLFRNVSIARGLALPIGGYLCLKSILAVDLFANPAGAVEFIEKVQFVQSTDFTPEVLNYLFTYLLDQAPGNIMPLTWASQVLGDIRTRIQSAQATLLAGGANPTESLRKSLTGIGWPDALVADAVALLASPTGLSVQVPGAPAVTIPPGLTGLVTYRAADGTLAASPGLTVNQWNDLNTANGAGAVPAAIASLRAEVTAFATALPDELHELQSFELPTFTVNCATDPSIAQSLAQQCYFDAAQQKLVFIGWMSDSQHTQLHQTLPAAQAGLADQLKAQSDQYQEPEPLNRFLFDVNATQALFAANQTPDSRVQAVLAKMNPFVARTTLIAQLGQALDLDTALIDPLLTSQLSRATALNPLVAPEFIGSDSRVTPTPAAFGPQFRALCKVHKAALILRTFQVQAAELAWLPPAIADATPFNVLSLDALPVAHGDPMPDFEAWRRLALLFAVRDDKRLGDAWIARLQDLLSLDPATLTAVQADVAHQQSFLAQTTQSTNDDVVWAVQTQMKLQWPADYQSAANVTLFIQWLMRLQLGRALGVSAQDVADAAAQLGLSWPQDFADPAKLATLIQLLTTVQRLGVGAAGAISLVQDAAPVGTNPAKPGEDEAHLARKVLRARYDLAGWPANLKKVVDSLRDKQRAALVSYLIANPPADAVGSGLWTGPDDLYDHFLIDPQMSPCRTSSRILHAISAVQLFIQRCTLNLEPDVSPSVIAAERLPWMSQFRLWQANRKVFLFPENWIEPELRDDKSEIFTDLEGQLLQDELDSTRAAEIIQDYLKELEAISHLAILGLYVEKATDALGNPQTRVHMVGRTCNQPAHFYYRRWVVSTLTNSWEPWERVALEGIKSDHILPFVMRGDVYIAWPEITQMAADAGTGSTDAGPSWRVQLAWIRRTSQGWSDRLMSADTLEHPWVYNKDENQTFTFRVRGEQSGAINIDCYGAQRDGGDGLLYTEPSTGDVPASRVPGPVADNSPWINVQISGVIYASYSGASGSTVWAPLQGATVAVATNLQGSAQQKNDASHDLNSDVQGSNYSNTDRASTLTGADGTFMLQLDLFAQMHTGWFQHNAGYYEDSVLDASPSFDVTVSYPGKPSQPISFPYADPNDNDQHQYWAREQFQQNFIIAVDGAAPTGLADRPVSMVPLQTFRLYAADDASLIALSTPFPALPDGVQTYGSGFQFTGSNQGAALSFDSTNTLNAPIVWTGVGSQYTLLRNAPFDPDTSPGADPSAVTSADVCVYRDNYDCYFIRLEESQTDPQATVGDFQILLDGHPRVSDLRQAAVSSPADLFDLTQQSWTGAAANATNQTFDNHAASALADLPTSLTLPAIYFEPDAAQSPYAKYNAELFFQVPFLIATYLSRNQRFVDAQTWLQYVFNPTTDDTAPVPERYWRYLPFRIHSRTTPIDELLQLLADPAVATSNPDKRDITTQIEIWLQNPFAPHAIARTRPRAYEFSVVFKYLDNLIAWGDSLFRQYSTESINTATQLYILAAKLLGPRPQSIPRAHPPAPLTYRDVNNKWDDFSNAWVEIESNLTIHPTLPPASRSFLAKVPPGRDLSHLSSVGTLYFCVPGNDKIQDYWDALDQRLFNIRHCRNIDGVEQPVPLFQPPIDPALLVQAVAAGVDISAVVADTAAPTPSYRFNTVLQKAMDLCNEVKAFGGALLSALEKKDAEDLALLRSGQELEMLSLVQAVKESQVAEAKANIDTLLQSEQVATTRFVQYQRLLGKNGAKVPDDAGADVEQSSAVRIAGGDATGDFGSLGLTQPEYDQIGYSEDALRFGTVAGIHSVVSGILYAIPGTQAGTPFLSEQFGGLNLGSVVSAAGSFWSILERDATHQGSRSASIGQYQRRQDDWVFQSRTALRDIQQIRKQQIAAQIRLDISQKELENHQRQIENAEESDRFLREKYTNRDLYQWMTQQVSAVYFQAYQLAYDLAKRAERCFRFELGLSDSSFINFGYWDNLKKGLMAGERLALDLKLMEAAYLDQNRREYEITKHVSLMQLDPGALAALRELGGCELAIPEVLFDLDFPGHYFRRLKSVGLSIPCVVGPYAGVPATLKLVKSTVRTQSTVDSGYPQGADDSRFIDILSGIQTVATSSGQNDMGLFESNLRDERFLPFEGMGAISTWRIELPGDFRPFDYDSIADVILHIRYTARDGGDDLKSAAIGNLKSGLNSVVRMTQGQGLTRMFSLKSDFSSEWYRLTNPAIAGADATADLVLSRNRFPYLFSSNQLKLTITGVDLYAVPDPSVQNPTYPDFLAVSIPGDPTPLDWPNSTAIGPLPGKSASTSVAVSAQDAAAKWTLKVPAANVAAMRDQTDDLLLVCRYKVA